MTASRRTQKKQRVFKSVFDTDLSQPTPHSTPSLRFPEKGQPFGVPIPVIAHASPGPVSSSNSDLKSPSAEAAPSTLTTEQARWDRAWHAVTSRIQLPASVAAEDSFGPLAPESQDLDLDFYDGLRVVLHPAQHAPHAAYNDDVLSWHTQQVRHHFVQHVLPLLSACDDSVVPADVVSGSIRTLEAAHRQYLYGLSLIMRGMDERMADVAVARFRRDLHAIISNSMSRALVASVRSELGRFMEILLNARTHRSPSSSPSSKPRRSSTSGFREDAQTHAARQGLLDLVKRLHKVGLAGEKFHILFAEMMDELMVEHVKASFAGLWKRSSSSTRAEETPHSSSMRRAARDGTQSPSIASLCDWVENCYARLAVEVLARLDGAEVGWKDLEKWKEIAIGRLAVLRIHELFDIVLHWPASREALDDLRMAVTTPQRRLQLTDTFSAALQKRLLHPGRSTLDILQVYISMIRTFHALDPSKVLLDRVVHSLQLYLCQRDDAIRIVVTGLLSNPDELNADGTGKTKLVELSALLNDPSQQQRQAHEDEDLDWDDMKWLPDPVDAGVNYKRPKSEDVVGTLIDALGSQDIFIKEFQNIIAERLLSTQTDFSQEVKVLDLLKRRFGEAALQNCDVMMKDIQDSKRVDTVISRNLKASRSAAADNIKAEEAAICHAKILSRLFWPALEREHFLLPQPIVDVQRQYDSEFEHLKSSRKLTWLNNLGMASVHLELEDRTVDKECKTFEATVIYAFQNEDGDESSAPVQRTVDELYETLQMDDDIIRLALSFWASHRVLRQVAPDTFAVVERLDDDTTEGGYSSTAGGDAPLESAASPVKTGGGGMDAQEKERRQVYWQFIVGMLTNSAPAMALGQMSMMMKMLVVDGFSWSNEELQEFLGEKMAEGELELAGGKYRLPKK